MANFEAPHGMTPEPEPGQYPETKYINRFESETNPPPPEFDTLDPVPAWQVREEAYEPRSLVPLPPLEVRRKKVYSALVRAAIAGALNPDQLAAGVRPRPLKLLPFAGISLQQRETYFRQLLNREPTEVFEKAYNRAQEIVSPPEMPWPPRPTPKDKQQNSYERLTELLSAMAEQEQVPKNEYFSWRDGVSSYYHGPLSQELGNPENVEWGMYYAEDLVRYPAMATRRLKSPERRQLEDSFIHLRGIPHLDMLEDLKGIVADLPQGTPVLCFTDNAEAVTLRAHPNISSQHLEPRSWQGPMVLLLNLVMLRNLRTMGRATSGGRLHKLTGYSPQKLEQNLESLHHRLGAGSGVLKRSKRNPDARRTLFWINDNSFVLDARPRMENPELDSDSTLT